MTETRGEAARPHVFTESSVVAGSARSHAIRSFAFLPYSAIAKSRMSAFRGAFPQALGMRTTASESEGVMANPSMRARALCDRKGDVGDVFVAVTGGRVGEVDLAGRPCSLFFVCRDPPLDGVVGG